MFILQLTEGLCLTRMPCEIPRAVVDSVHCKGYETLFLTSVCYVFVFLLAEVNLSSTDIKYVYTYCIGV
jgi:hypothetical protein